MRACVCVCLFQMYITSTIKTKSSRLAKPVLCLGIMCAAFLSGLNRVSEYRNHCSDVIAGFILGSSVALFLVGFIVSCHCLTQIIKKNLYFLIFKYVFYCLWLFFCFVFLPCIDIQNTILCSVVVYSVVVYIKVISLVNNVMHHKIC